MRKLGIFLIIFVSFTFFSFNEKVDAASVPISKYDIDESDIERFISESKIGLDGFKCNIYNGKFYKNKGVLYWTANFGQNKNSFIKFKLNNKNYVDLATITRYMPKPMKNSWQEYSTESKTAIQEIYVITYLIVEQIMRYYDDEQYLEKVYSNELMSALQKIKTQVEQGKTIDPYDHTSSVYISEVEKTFNIRVYWSESFIYIGLSASR